MFVDNSAQLNAETPLDTTFPLLHLQQLFKSKTARTNTANMKNENKAQQTSSASRTFADVLPSALNGGISVYVGQLAQAEPLLVVVGVSKAVHNNRVHRGVEHFAHPIVEFIVHDAGPALRLLNAADENGQTRMVLWTLFASCSKLHHQNIRQK